MFALSRMNVEDANKKLKAEKEIAADEVTDASDIN
jgi:GPH family glycoside/pentoside/hexuronide:cation symporter